MEEDKQKGGFAETDNDQLNTTIDLDDSTESVDEGVPGTDSTDNAESTLPVFGNEAADQCDEGNPIQIDDQNSPANVEEAKLENQENEDASAIDDSSNLENQTSEGPLTIEDSSINSENHESEGAVDGSASLEQSDLPQSPLLVEPSNLLIDEGPETESNVDGLTGSNDAELNASLANGSCGKQGPPQSEEQANEENEDDDIIMLESRIKPSRASSLAEDARPSGNNPTGTVAPPPLLKTITDGLQEAITYLTSAAMRQPATKAQQPTPSESLPQQTTSAASVLKALITRQGSAPDGGTLPNLQLVTIENKNSTASKTMATPALIPATTVAVPVTSQQLLQPIQLQQLLLKPSSASGASSGTVVIESGQRSVQPRQPGQVAYVNVQEAPEVCVVGTSPKRDSLLEDACPKHLKSVLDPASVLPYRGEIPPAEFGFLTPDEGYRCEECGDVFGYKTCLEFHLQRRSMVIESNCLICRQRLVFFNKCVYYSHIRGHGGGKRKVAKMVMQNVNVKPITWELMELMYEDTAYKRMLNYDEIIKYETGSAPLVTAADFGDEADESAVDVTVGSDDQPANATNVLATLLSNASAKHRCNECTKNFNSSQLLRQHFMYNLPTNQKQLICSNCQAVYFSQCSFRAHVRTHQKSGPFVCPECGAVEDSSVSLYRHLSTHQKNPTVMDAWRCQKCLTFYSSWDALIVHVSVSHCDSYYRCQLCPMAFQSTENFEQHLKLQHGNVATSELSGAPLLTKCCQCDVIYPAREPLLDHLKSHYSKLMPFVVYRCALCGRLMENKNGLLGHFRKVHRLDIQSNDVVPVKILVNANVTPTNKSTAAGSSSSEPYLFSCPQCPNMVFHNRLSLKLHFNRRHGRAAGTDANGQEADSKKKEKTMETGTVYCRCCKKKFSDPTQLVEHGRDHIRQGSLVCLFCRNFTFASPIALARHLQRHVELQISQGMPFECVGHCVQSFTSTVDALQHLNDLHGLGSFCSYCAVFFASDHSLRVHMAQRHKETVSNVPENTHRLLDFGSSSKDGETRKRASANSSEGPSPAKQSLSDSQSPSIVRCNKCGVRFPNLDEMHVHALSHKEPKNYLCLECGFSFVTPASLGRHLMISHKISDGSKYLDENPDANPEKPSELQCTVCHVEFSSKALLDAHVRTHGLLFLKTKARASSS